MEFKKMTSVQLETLITIATEELGPSIRDDMTEMYGPESSFIAQQNDQLLGCAFYQRRESDDKINYDIGIFVRPEFRRKKVATAMLIELESRLAPENPDGLFIYNLVTQYDSSGFLTAQHYSPWYASSLLSCENHGLAPVDIECAAYEDKHYDQVSELRSKSFESLRKENDMKPYYILGSSEERELMKKESHLYHLLFDEQKIIGVLKFSGNFIGLLAVDEAYRGRGYGKRLMNFAMNKISSDNHTSTKLGIIDTNKDARKLYESLGFKTEATLIVNRKIMK